MSLLITPYPSSIEISQPQANQALDTSDSPTFGGLILTPGASVPTPASGAQFGVTTVAGRPMPGWTIPTGMGFFVQEALWPLSFAMSYPAASSVATIGTAIGNTIDSSTPVNTAPANTSRFTRQSRITYTSVAAINRGAGIQRASASGAAWWRGNAAGLGGFFAFFRFAFQTYALGNRAFLGMHASGTEANFWTADPSAQTGDYIGLGMDAADTALSLYTRDNVTTTKTAITGMPAAAGSGALFLDFYLYAKPNDTVIYYRVDDMVAGTTLVDSSLSTTIPRSTVLMSPLVSMGSGSVAGGCALAFMKLYVIGPTS